MNEVLQSFLKLISAMDFYLPGLYKYNWMGLFPNDFQNYITDHGENQQQAAYWPLVSNGQCCETNGKSPTKHL